MKLLSIAYLFYLSPTGSFGFSPSSIALHRRPRHHQPLAMGWVTDFLSDISDDIEEQKLIFSRFLEPDVTKARQGGATLKEATPEQKKIHWEQKEDGIFGFIPTKEMTGIEPHMTQVCATLSRQLYDAKSIDEFKLSTKDNDKVEVLIYDDHGSFRDATPPFAAVVSGSTMILGWRGTNTVSDILSDVAFPPQSSLAWRRHGKTIKTQGAMTSLVHNDFVTHEVDMIKEIKARGIKNIITTGHSLGGGAAQVAHITLRAQIEDESSPWHAVSSNIETIRSVTFCAPMTVCLLDNATPETDDFVEALNDHSCNVIYSNDPVPRGYGFLSFMDDFIQDCAEELVDNVPIFGSVKFIFDFKGKCEDYIDDFMGSEDISRVLGYVSRYRHMGNLIYYEEEDSKPRILRDMGAFFKNSKGIKDVLRDVKYNPVRKPSVDAMDWHNDVVFGPGLSYPKEKLF